jgi:diguanylate cyclase (GGDEF)-like protein
MPPAPLPVNEAQRLAILRNYDLLDHSQMECLNALCSMVGKAFQTPIALVSISDESRQVFKGRLGLDINELARELAPCAYAILQNDVMVVSDTTKDPRFADNPLVLSAPNIRFYVGKPLLSPEGMPLGTLCAMDFLSREPSPEQMALLHELACTTMTLLDMRRLLRTTRTLAITDTLTGLHNRGGLMTGLDNAITIARRHSVGFAVMLLDADNFKWVNDTMGHAAGDEVLRLAADVLQHFIRGDDLAARLGGDEFAVVMLDIDAATARARAGDLHARLTECMADHGYPVGFSIGVACFDTAPEDAAEVMVASDRLMYRAKQNGKNQVFCGMVAGAEGGAAVALAPMAPLLTGRKAGLSQTSRQEATIDGPDAAIARDKGSAQAQACFRCREEVSLFPFTMAFQPIVDLQEKRIDAYEALVRGPAGEKARHVLSQVTPENLYAFDQACRAKAIEMAGTAGLRRRLNINFQPNAVYSPSACIRKTLKIAAKVAFPLDLLTFEIVEGEALAETRHLKQIIDEYRRHGFKIALDDFATGYSGLARLVELRPDIIKLDHVLVADCDRDQAKMAILGGLVRITAEIGVKVVAEGVERLGEALALQEAGVRFMQGFYFATPLLGRFAGDEEIDFRLETEALSAG